MEKKTFEALEAAIKFEEDGEIFSMAAGQKKRRDHAGIEYNITAPPMKRRG